MCPARRIRLHGHLWAGAWPPTGTCTCIPCTCIPCACIPCTCACTCIPCAYMRMHMHTMCMHHMLRRLHGYLWAGNTYGQHLCIRAAPGMVGVRIREARMSFMVTYGQARAYHAHAHHAYAYVCMCSMCMYVCACACACHVLCMHHMLRCFHGDLWAGSMHMHMSAQQV